MFRSIAAVLAIMSFLCMEPGAACAQFTSKVQFSIGPDVGVVTGTLANTHTAMFGGSVQVGLPLNRRLYFTIDGGYNYFLGKRQSEAQPPNIPEVNYIGVKSVPAKLGLKYYLSSIWFVQGEAGAAFFSGTPRTSYEAGTAFVYSPQIGVELPAGSHRIIASLRYQSTLPKANNAVKVSFLGLHAGFCF
ncbi:hypothetical protein IDJ77_12990 [Mucilaginibacter sp. ZT4R22]|uniref:Outer membrane protein beta-barrel domain-containing protein n=1 Tax=Mucilaginibacter pankratovii TaxID=2772110 RepID=A0ABR7WTL1_9SPHI|nr:outer membrane beta-barrel protein [Mucilaginibacter pankratovii]MBD1364729.1 hypothetical protein [Mucilaginibacter pankratovii]